MPENISDNQSINRKTFDNIMNNFPHRSCFSDLLRTLEKNGMRILSWDVKVPNLHFKSGHTEVPQLSVAEHLVLRVQLEHIDCVVQHHRVGGLAVTLEKSFQSHWETKPAFLGDTLLYIFVTDWDFIGKITGGIFCIKYLFLVVSFLSALYKYICVKTHRIRIA